MTRHAFDALMADASKTVQANGKQAILESYDPPPHAQIPDAEPLKRPVKLARDCEGEAPRPSRIALRFTLRRVRLLDPCAKFGSCKALIDGLRYASILHDDTEEAISLEVTQEKVAHFKDEETLIEITIP